MFAILTIVVIAIVFIALALPKERTFEFTDINGVMYDGKFQYRGVWNPETAKVQLKANIRSKGITPIKIKFIH